MAYAPPLWNLANFQSDGVVYSPPGWFNANFWPGLPPIIVYPPTYGGTTGAGTAAAVWSAVVTIAGVDVSARIVGDIRVEASEGAARIAELTIRPANGTGFAISDWSGKAITIDVVDMATGVATDSRRLFTGIIDTPTLDLNLRTIGLLATDNLQNQIEALSAASIDTLVPGGYHSPVIFDPAARGWSRAQDRLATVPASLDLSPTGDFRVSDWEPRAAPNISFTEAHILDGSLNATQSGRHQIVNRVDIDFAYRFPRVKSEGYGVEYSYVSVGSLAAHVNAGNWFLTRAAVESALSAAGAAIISIVYDPLPAFGVPPWVPGPSDYLLCMGFTARVSFEYAQIVEEQHAITVSAPESIAVIGTLRDRMTGALEGQYPPIDAVEHSMMLYAKSISSIPPKDSAPINDGFTTSADVTLTTDTNRAAADTAMETLIAVAKAKIWASHRRNTVTAAVALNPDVDLPRTIDVNVSGQLHARGKCFGVTHTLSPSTGSAITSFSLAICSVAGTGIVHPDSVTIAPAGSVPATTALVDIPDKDFNSGPAEDHVFTVTFPAVAPGERNKLDIPIASSYSAAIVEDIFDVTL